MHTHAHAYARAHTHTEKSFRKRSFHKNSSHRFTSNKIITSYVCKGDVHAYCLPSLVRQEKEKTKKRDSISARTAV